MQATPEEPVRELSGDVSAGPNTCSHGRVAMSCWQHSLVATAVSLLECIVPLSGWRAAVPPAAQLPDSGRSSYQILALRAQLSSALRHC